MLVAPGSRAMGKPSPLYQTPEQRAFIPSACSKAVRNCRVRPCTACEQAVAHPDGQSKLEDGVDERCRARPGKDGQQSDQSQHEHDRQKPPLLVLHKKLDK